MQSVLKGLIDILYTTITVAINNGSSTGATKSQPTATHSSFFRDSENQQMTSEVMQPNRLLNFSWYKTEAVTCLKAQSGSSTVVGKCVLSDALCQALC